MSSRLRLAAGLAVGAAVVALGACPPPTVAPITEDDPAWDCATMGNRICGPVAVILGPDGSARITARAGLAGTVPVRWGALEQLPDCAGATPAAVIVSHPGPDGLETAPAAVVDPLGCVVAIGTAHPH